MLLAGRWEADCDNFQPGNADDWVETTVAGSHIFALYVKGDSMEPEFQDGDIIVVNPHMKADHNDYVIVRNDEEEATFKQLKKYEKTCVLHPLNPKYPDIVLSDKKQYKIIGKVVEKVKRKRY
jgi:SOS-response transcriptional repressor LexA